MFCSKARNVALAAVLAFVVAPLLPSVGQLPNGAASASQASFSQAIPNQAIPNPAAEKAAGNTAGQRIIRISHDNGGSVVDYARRMTRLRQQSAQVEFRGPCASACTMFLALERQQTCIRPGAKFGFHKAFGADQGANQWGTAFLLERYPQWVRSWIEANGGLTHRLIWMDYAYAAQHMPSCTRT